jgi:hypothetical protein
MRRRSTWAALILVGAGLSCDPGGPGGAGRPKPGEPRAGVTEAAIPAEGDVVDGQTIYVPYYPFAFTADSAHPFNLAATLYVRNTDRSRPIILTSVQEFGADGKLRVERVKAPLRIAPMASTDFFVRESDVEGGPGPSFVVEWVATGEVSGPVVESLMIGTGGTQGVSFVSPGRVVASKRR